MTVIRTSLYNTNEATKAMFKNQRVRRNSNPKKEKRGAWNKGRRTPR